MTTTTENETHRCPVCRHLLASKAFRLTSDGGNVFCDNCTRTRDIRRRARRDQQRAVHPPKPAPSAELVEAGSRYVRARRAYNVACLNLETFINSTTVDDDTAAVSATINDIAKTSGAARDAAAVALAYFVMVDSESEAERKRAEAASIRRRAAERRKEARSRRETLDLMRAPSYRTRGGGDD